MRCCWRAIWCILDFFLVQSEGAFPSKDADLSGEGIFSQQSTQRAQKEAGIGKGRENQKEEKKLREVLYRYLYRLLFSSLRPLRLCGEHLSGG